jgi:hypothetical protein
VRRAVLRVMFPTVSGIDGFVSAYPTPALRDNRITPDAASSRARGLREMLTFTLGEPSFHPFEGHLLMMRRREFIAGLGSAAAWPVAALPPEILEPVRRQLAPDHFFTVNHP